MFLARWPSFFGRADRLDRPERQRGHRDGMHDVVGQLVGLQRIGDVAHLGQVALGELVGVGDHHPAARQVADVGLQRRRVHRDQDVGPVAGGQDVVVGDLNLEGRDPGQSACGGADLGGVVRLGRKVVAEKRGLRGEPVAGELHAVAGVTGETDDDLFEALTVGPVLRIRLVGLRSGCRCRSDPRLSPPLVHRTGTPRSSRLRAVEVTPRPHGCMSLAVPIMALFVSVHSHLRRRTHGQFEPKSRSQGRVLMGKSQNCGVGHVRAPDAAVVSGIAVRYKTKPAAAIAPRQANAAS